MSQSLGTLLCATFALALRSCVGLAGYSGEATPPMFGDYEAQRHWMEITVNLPPKAWYVNGPDNDLMYWGLDYPPLSAHLSWILAWCARAFGHDGLVALHKSRGLETPPTRAFMRNTVLVCDAIVFFSAAASFAAAAVPRQKSATAQPWLLLQILLVPALILTDHGHFQYNCVSLGLTLWAARWALGGRPLASCVAFSLALNFKQMTLYLAPAFFCYLLAGCLRHGATVQARLAGVVRLGLAVVATFAACWLPFLSDADVIFSVLRRVFPVERSLYEDKVANLWCTLALVPVLKLKQLLGISALLRLALLATLSALLPPCILLLRRPSRLGFLLCATACGLAFFLCSYQVHEKHILLPLLPASLLAHRHPGLFGWFATAAGFSLFPLLKRDGLRLPYAVLQIAFLCLSLGLCPSRPNVTNSRAPAASAARALPLPPYVAPIMMASVAGMVILHILDATWTPPGRYPDLLAVVFAAYSCMHFCMAYAALLAAQWWAAACAKGRDEHTPMDTPIGHARPTDAELIFVFGEDSPLQAKPKGS